MPATALQMGEVSVTSRSVPMQVIVAGVHRTGTTSIRLALMQLGYNDMYHMLSARERMDTDPAKWVEAYKGKYTDEREPFTKEEWDDLLGNAQACADLPSAPFSVELSQFYPEAKVIILNRDAEKWYESALNTIYPAMHPKGLTLLRLMYASILDPAARQYGRFSRVINESLGYDHAAEKDKAIAWYNNIYQEFREGIPKERYIEYRVQDGWKPLCEFLDVPVPLIKDDKTGELVEAPFPRVNDTVSFQKKVASSNMTKTANDNLFAFIGRVAVTGALGYGGYLMWKSRLGGRL